MVSGDTQASRRPFVRATLLFALLLVLVLVLARTGVVSVDIRSVGLGFIAANAFSLLALLAMGITVKLLNGPPVRYAHAVKSGALAIGLSLVLPARLSDGLKPVYLAAVSGLPLSRGLAAVLTERFLDIVCVGAFMALAITITGQDRSSLLMGVAGLFWGVMLAGLLGVVLLWTAPAVIDRALAIIPWGGVRAMAQKFAQAIRQTVAAPRLCAALVSCLATWTFSYLLFWSFLAFAGPIPLQPADVLNVFLLASLGLVIAVAPGGLGTFEAASIMALGFYGYPIDVALPLVIVLRLAIFVVPFIGVATVVLWDEVDLAGLLDRLRRRDR